jgi:hypothetical protein
MDSGERYLARVCHTVHSVHPFLVNQKYKWYDLLYTHTRALSTTKCRRKWWTLWPPWQSVYSCGFPLPIEEFLNMVSMDSVRMKSGPKTQKAQTR